MSTENLSRYAIFVGDVRDKTKDLVDKSLQCIVTSPPYFGHRDYSEGDRVPQEIGSESEVDVYVQNLAQIFHALRGKLADDGLLWLNLGDTYREGRQLGVPWRVALALSAHDWYLRSDIIWNKPNAMPSSVKSRPTVSHEYIFLFSKSRDYFYNADAIREPHVTFSKNSKMRGGRGHFGKKEGTPEKGKNEGDSNLHGGRWDQAFHPLGRNKRTVWDIPLGKFRGAHFAVFPEKLAETCILASTRVNDIVFDPFTGAGTTGLVALKNGRKFMGIELYAHNEVLATKRLDTYLGEEATSKQQQNLFDGF